MGQIATAAPRHAPPDALRRLRRTDRESGSLESSLPILAEHEAKYPGRIERAIRDLSDANPDLTFATDV